MDSQSRRFDHVDRHMFLKLWVLTLLFVTTVLPNTSTNKLCCLGNINIMSVSNSQLIDLSRNNDWSLILE